MIFQNSPQNPPNRPPNLAKRQAPAESFQKNVGPATHTLQEWSCFDVASAVARNLPPAKVAAVAERVLEERISGDVMALLDESTLKDILQLAIGDCLAIIQARTALSAH